MPKKQQTKKTTSKKNTKKVAEVVPEPEVVEESPQEEDSPEESPQENSSQEQPVENKTEVKERKKRRVVNHSTVLESFESLVASVEAEITKLRENPNKSKGVKFLRTLGKNLKQLKNDFNRVSKTKQKTERKQNNQSGFMKPVQISKEMAKFTKWDDKSLHSRVEVTKHLCDYIKKNNLQNPEDKRQIKADKNLCKLLRYDPKKADKPLTYCVMQSLIQHHFTKPETTVST